MAEQTFLTYQRFIDKHEAEEMAAILKEYNIDFLLEDYSAGFDPSFSNNELLKEYRIKLRKTDFEQADLIQKSIAESQLNTIGKDYYLFTFTDQELIDVITKIDEWNQLDYMLAQKILKDRGIDINNNTLESLKKERMQELARPDENQKGWIIAGYLFALFGGLPGIFAGWHLSTHKKTLPNGDRVYAYCLSDRIHGKRILILGVISLILWSAAKIYFME